MAAGTPLSAKNCKVRINNTVLYNSKWTATPESAMLDTSNMEGAGFEDQIGGLVNGLRAFAHQEFWIVVEDGGPAAAAEEVGFSRELGAALNSAHWIKTQKIWQRMGAAGFQQVQMQDYSRGGDSGIVIFAAAASTSAGEALNRELRRLSVRSSLEPDENLKNAILIFVGPP